MKKTWLIIFVTAIVLGVGGYFAYQYLYKPQAASSCTAVEVFASANFTNTQTCLPAGDYTTTQLGERFSPDNSISSITIPEGYSVTVYSDDNFAGQSKTFTSSVSDLSNYLLYENISPVGGTQRWDDQISSIKVVSGTQTTSGAVNLTANNVEATTVTAGQSVTLRWTISGENMSSSKYCSATPTGWFPTTESLTGSATVTPNTTTTYKLSCWPSTGSEATAVSDEVVVTVNAVAPSTTTVSLKVNNVDSATITAGQSATLSWNISGATNISSSCTATPTGWFKTNQTGTASVSPTSTTTYKITCGTVSDSVVLTVGTANTEPDPDPDTNTNSSSSSSSSSSASSSSSSSTSGTSGSSSSSASTTVANSGPETPVAAVSLLLALSGALVYIRRFTK